jgi:hypothetical protein
MVLIIPQLLQLEEPLYLFHFIAGTNRDFVRVTYTRVPDWMIGFIDRLYEYIPLGTTGNTALSLIYILQFTFTHALGFSVFGSRLLATDL